MVIWPFEFRRFMVFFCPKNFHFQDENSTNTTENSQENENIFSLFLSYYRDLRFFGKNFLDSENFHQHDFLMDSLKEAALNLPEPNHQKNFFKKKFPHDYKYEPLMGHKILQKQNTAMGRDSQPLKNPEKIFYTPGDIEKIFHNNNLSKVIESQKKPKNKASKIFDKNNKNHEKEKEKTRNHQINDLHHESLVKKRQNLSLNNKFFLSIPKKKHLKTNGEPLSSSKEKSPSINKESGSFSSKNKVFSTSNESFSSLAKEKDFLTNGENDHPFSKEQNLQRKSHNKLPQKNHEKGYPFIKDSEKSHEEQKDLHHHHKNSLYPHGNIIPKIENFHNVHSVDGRSSCHGHRQRLRERFLKAPKVMTDYELIELLLFWVYPRQDVKQKAKDHLQNHGGSFSVFFQKESQKLSSSLGFVLTLIQEVSARLLLTQIKETPLLNDSKKVLDYCRLTMAHLPREEFRIFFLDRLYGLLGEETQQVGTVDQVSLYPREVLKRALDMNATSIILAHNHPSGNTTPSKADKDLTSFLSKSLAPFNVTLLDHFIVGHEGHFSFREHGLL